MQNAALTQDVNLRRLVHDFDALADVLHTLVDRDRLTSSHGETVAGGEVEFTTEWQMASTAYEAHEE
jgi:hypothetical protein